MKTLLFIAVLLASPINWAYAGNELPPEIPFPAVEGTNGPDLPIAPDAPAAPLPVVTEGLTQTMRPIDDLPSGSSPRQKKKGTWRKNKRRHENIGMDDYYSGQPPERLDFGLSGGNVIKARPGVTEDVVIARGKLNRIVTPYLNPKVLTVDTVETKVDGSSIYVATDSGQPVSLFITDADTGGAASLQLTPQSLASPVELTIAPDEGKPMEGSGEVSSKLFKQDSPYVSDVKAIMQALGKQLVPSGFSLVDGSEGTSYEGICHGVSLAFSLGQVLKSGEAQVVVFVAVNNGTRAAVFEESFCASDSTVAVAAWPKVRLGPGERTEVYVLVRQPERRDGEMARPALL